MVRTAACRKSRGSDLRPRPNMACAPQCSLCDGLPYRDVQVKFFPRSCKTGLGIFRERFVCLREAVVLQDFYHRSSGLDPDGEHFPELIGSHCRPLLIIQRLITRRTSERRVSNTCFLLTLSGWHTQKAFIELCPLHKDCQCKTHNSEAASSGPCTVSRNRSRRKPVDPR
jgi:hypothetical protein